MLPTCVGHPQNLLLPHPHSLLFAFIVVVQSIGRWSAETGPRDNREEGRVPSPTSSGYSRDKQRKSATASSESSQKSNIRSRSGDKPQRPEIGRQHQQQPQRPTQGKPNNQNNLPYRDYRYSDQLRQTQFNEKQNQMYSPYHFAPFPCTLCRLRLT